MVLTKAKFTSMDLTPSYLTPAMEEVIARRAERLASGSPLVNAVVYFISFYGCYNLNY